MPRMIYYELPYFPLLTSSEEYRKTGSDHGAGEELSKRERSNDARVDSNEFDSESQATCQHEVPRENNTV